MKLRFLLLGAILTSLAGWGAERPQPGQQVDLAAFGHVRQWDGNPGIEWDETRDVRRVEVEFSDAKSVPPPSVISVEYWVSTWPPSWSGGWTNADTPWQGEWRTIAAIPEVAGRSIVFRIQPLTETENANAKHVPGYTPSFRRTLKIRLHFTGRAAATKALHMYGDSHWNARRINVQTGLEGHAPVRVSATAYNGFVGGSSPLASKPPGTQLEVFYAEHSPGSNDRTILTLHGAGEAFGVSVDDLIERKAVYVKPLGIFLGDAAVKEDFAAYLESGVMHPGEDIISRVSRHPEQTLDGAFGEIPRLALMADSRLRYFPLGFPTSREKYALDFTGNVFISKGDSKAMKEDLAGMLWQGDRIYFRLGTGTNPDFRERELGTKQALLDHTLPLVITEWQTEGIGYQEEAYATMLDAPLDDVHLRGDEPSVLFLRLHANNPDAKSAEAHVWFCISPLEQTILKDGLLLGTGDKEGAYASPRLRAGIEAVEGSLEIRELSPAAEWQLQSLRPSDSKKENPPSRYGGKAVLWKVSLPAHGSAVLDLKIPFRTMLGSDEQERVKQARFEKRVGETLDYWKKAMGQGMRIHVPDEELNRFWNTALQHILVTVERDVKTGFDMCACATYAYKMFANETDVQAQLLDMMGRHDWAWRCLRPIMELQGSAPFPGNFRDTSAILHGVRVDAEHDYTHVGYNLNHGWTLWTLAEHYLFTRDKEWLKGAMPHLIKAADWIISERQATMQREPDGTPVPEYGLLPAGQLEDNTDFEYWFAVNGYAYRGLRAASEAVSALDPATGARLKKEAEAYRADLRRAVFHSMSLAPVVPLRDGTFVPAVPPRTSLHGRELGWIRNVLYGAHALVDCGVLDVDEPLTTWILQDYEDNLFMAEDSFSVPDRDWFSRGGIALQPNLVNTFESYLKRDQVPQALRAYFNDFAVSYYPDVAAFTEWVPTLGIGGGPFFKTSDEAKSLIWLRLMLVREEGDRLYLNYGAPRAWFLPGRTIEVAGAVTFLGEVSFRVDSHPEEGFIAAHVLPPQRSLPREIQLRLRHPDGKPILRVELNGRSWSEFNPKKETISLPADQGEINVRAFYN
jgi:hypothetical protein